MEQKTCGTPCARSRWWTPYAAYCGAFAAVRLCSCVSFAPCTAVQFSPRIGLHWSSAVPVGFVNVVESKERLLTACEACGVPAIVALGRKSGSNVATAICNALVYSAVERLDPAARGRK